MRASRALLSTGEPAYAVDRNGVIVIWNAAAERIFGYTESDTVGKLCWDVLAGQDLFGNQYCCQHCPIRDMAFHHQSVKTSKLFFKTASNGLKQFSVTTLVIYDNRGEAILVHLCRPIDEMAVDCSTTMRANQPTGNHQRGALTTREKEVLTLLSQGKSTTDVAEDLCISEATVRNHTQHALHKLHVHNRLAAINLGRKLGLI